MSRALSPSQQRCYGVVRVCQEWGVRRSTFYHQQGRVTPPPCALAKRGPKTAYTDEVLTAHIRQVLAASPFLGEGHRKVWARLRAQGIRTSKPRVLRLMRQANLLAPSWTPRVVGPRVHDGTITTERPNQMWGTDATSTVTQQDGPVTVFVGVGSAGIATGLQVRHDHGSQYMSDDFQAELRFLSITSSPAFVRAPEGNGVAERFIRTLKEQLLWVRTFQTVEDLRQALHDWLRLYNEHWLVERHGFRAPAHVRQDFQATSVAA